MQGAQAEGSEWHIGVLRAHVCIAYSLIRTGFMIIVTAIFNARMTDSSSRRELMKDHAFLKADLKSMIGFVDEDE